MGDERRPVPSFTSGAWHLEVNEVQRPPEPTVSREAAAHRCLALGARRGEERGAGSSRVGSSFDPETTRPPAHSMQGERRHAQTVGVRSVGCLAVSETTSPREARIVPAPGEVNIVRFRDKPTRRTG